MTKRIVKIFSTILAVLLLIYIVFQVYMMIYPVYKTEVALLTTVDDSIAASGIVVRNETVIDTGGEGIRNFLVDSGDKVAKGSHVAELYATPEDALDNLMLHVLQAELDVLQRTAAGGRTAGTNLDSLAGRIYRTLADMAGYVTQENYARVSALRLQLLDLLNSYAVASGQAVNPSARIAEIESKIEELSARNVAPTGYIDTPIEGYFVSAVDGMESTVNMDAVHNMSVSDIMHLSKDKSVAVDTSACKIVADYAWRFAAVIDAKYASRFQQGAELMLDFIYADATSLPAKVVEVKTDTTAKNAVVILECSILNASIADLRCESAQLSFRNHSGILVQRSALRMEEGVVGVYIKVGSVVAFRAVDIVYETEAYVVSRVNSADSTVVGLYDEIIVSGKDLYVGKNLGS